MKVLVTGCNGQLGHEMQAVLEQELPGQAVYTDIDDLDITDAVKLKDFVIRNDITHIVNCAAYTAVDRAEEDKAICTKINVEAVRNLANAAGETGAKILHISTDYVFDGKAFRPYNESDKVNSESRPRAQKYKGCVRPNRNPHLRPRRGKSHRENNQGPSVGTGNIPLLQLRSGVVVRLHTGHIPPFGHQRLHSTADTHRGLPDHGRQTIFQPVQHIQNQSHLQRGDALLDRQPERLPRKNK